MPKGRITLTGWSEAEFGKRISERESEGYRLLRSGVERFNGRNHRQKYWAIMVKEEAKDDRESGLGSA